ncbi:MAG: hypothetical protein NT164_01505 [Verrucomicrobiae bacterium]|nr:hypothetical protein [Verrucomicrobiae bacterium]
MLSRPTLVETMSLAGQARSSCALQMKAFTPGSQRHVASLLGTSTLREYLHLAFSTHHPILPCLLAFQFLLSIPT